MATEVIGPARDVQPYSDIGIVFVTFPDGFRIEGTASIIGKNDILTALHMVYQPDHGGWAEDFDFYFGADYNHSTSKFDDYGYRYSPGRWDIYGRPDKVFADTENGVVTQEEAEYDYAIIGVNTPIGDTLGWLELDPRYDGDGILFSLPANSVGYPGGATGMMRETVSVQKFFFPGTYTMPSDLAALTMGPGSSGGPLLIENNIIGVKSGIGLWADIGYDFSSIVGFMDKNNSLLSSSIDITAPIVTVFSPADEATDVSISDNIIFNFSENIQRGIGDISVETTDDVVVETYDAATSSNLSISGSTLTIDPSVDLLYGTGYKIVIAVSAVRDMTGNSYAGTLSYNFTTAAQAGSNQNGGAGNDTFLADIGIDVIDGAMGLDTVIYSNQRSDYRVSKVNDGLGVIDMVGNGNVDNLTSIERLVFTDKNLAFDLDANENAGITAKILGAVFGKDSLTNKEYIGIGLRMLDNGTSYIDLMELAINTKLGVDANYADLVNLLYTNVMGIAPTAVDLDYFVEQLEDGTYTKSSLGIMAADTEININNINLIGLADTGLEFV